MLELSSLSYTFVALPIVPKSINKESAHFYFYFILCMSLVEQHNMISHKCAKQKNDKISS